MICNGPSLGMRIPGLSVEEFQPPSSCPTSYFYKYEIFVCLCNVKILNFQMQSLESTMYVEDVKDHTNTNATYGPI